MHNIARILAVLDGSDADAVVVSKAVALAHQQGAALELFLCDSQCAFSLRQSYDQTAVDTFRRQCIRQSKHYLDGVRDVAAGADVPITVAAACESPLYEGIVREVVRSRADLVIKSAASSNSRRRFGLDANDWQLMRACPATLLLSRGKSWQPVPRFVAAVDVSGEERAELPGTILGVCQRLCRRSHGSMEVVYSDSAETTPSEHARRVARLRSVADAAGIPSDTDIHVLAGEPELALPRFVTGRDHDAVVMGALTHHEGLSALVGTLTSKLVESLDCDFVLVKPAGYRTSIELTPTPVEVSTDELEHTDLQHAPAALGFVLPWQLPVR